MNQQRYADLMDSEETKLTQAEIDAGWHFCNEFDGLLVGPEMGELEVCKCLPEDHQAYKTHPARIGREWLKDSSLEKWFPITAEELSRLRTRLQQVESERDKAEADAAVMREALNFTIYNNHADNNRGMRSCLGHECRCCDTIKKALTTNAGKSLLLRLQEAERLLSRARPGMHTCETGQWFTDRDAFLNPKPRM